MRATAFANLPTLDQQQAIRRAMPKGSEPSRLQRKVAKQKDEAKDERRFVQAVWKRDAGKCRWCGRVVRKCLDLAPDRGEVHHVSGRVVKAIKYDRRNGLLLCAGPCHERLTGRINERFLLVPSRTFVVDGIAYANADHGVRFKRIA